MDSRNITLHTFSDQKKFVDKYFSFKNCKLLCILLLNCKAILNICGLMAKTSLIMNRKSMRDTCLTFVFRLTVCLSKFLQWGSWGDGDVLLTAVCSVSGTLHPNSSSSTMQTEFTAISGTREQENTWSQPRRLLLTASLKANICVDTNLSSRSLQSEQDSSAVLWYLVHPQILRHFGPLPSQLNVIKSRDGFTHQETSLSHN